MKNRHTRLSARGAVAAALFALPCVAQPATEPQAQETTPVVERPLPDSATPVLRVVEPVPGGLTSKEVAERTVARSAMVRARRASIDAAEAQINRTTIQFFPIVTLTASYKRLSPVSTEFGEGALVGAANPGPLTTGACPGGAGTCVLDAAGVPVGAAAFEIPNLEDNFSLVASASIPLSDYVTRLSNAIAAARAARSSAETAHRAEQLKVRTDARVLYYQWVRAVGFVGVAQKSLEQMRARRKDSEAAFQLGTISKSDLLRLEALVATAELGVKEAETARDLSAEQLRIVMGDQSTASYQVGEDLLAPAGGESVRGPLAALTREAVARRLELAAVGHDVHALEESASAVRTTAYPRLDAVGDVMLANPNPRYFPQQQEWNATWSVGVTATWTINNAFANSASAREIEANARSVQAQREALVDGIRQEVAATYLERERAATAVGTSQRRTAAAEEAYRVATDLYRVGRSTTTELIEAERDLIDARLNVLNAHVARRIAEVRLWHAVGRDVARTAR